MGLLDKILPQGFPWRKRLTVYDADAQRTMLRLRYHRFKRLLNANDKVLAAMTEMEYALRGFSPFGMDFVRSRTTVVSTGVYQAIKYLNDLAEDNRFKALYERFDAIKGGITPVLESRRQAADAPFVLRLSDVGREDVDRVGMKMANLGEAARALGLNVPEGFVITAAAYHAFMEHDGLERELERRRQADEGGGLDALYRLSSSLQRLIIETPVPEAVSEAIAGALEHLAVPAGGGQAALAVRSSGLNEDLKNASFAGQYRSVLNVAPQNILQAYKEIVASKYSATAMSYRLERGLRDEDAVMCAGCLKMVDALAGGVAYSRDPAAGGGDAAIINSAWGLPKLVVDGRSDVDRFTVKRTPEPVIVHREIAEKGLKYTCDQAEGVCRLDVSGEDSTRPSISDEQVLALARAVLAAEAHYGGPQDMEWAVRPDGGIVVLQCRPLGTAEEREIRAPSGEDERIVDAPIILEGGRAVSPGAAAGPAGILKKDADILRFPRDGVMVVMHALPKWAVLVGRCSAVISEYGGVTSHLASVAREFGKPAVFGLRGACDRLAGGRTVTVDGDSARVYDGEIAELIGSRTKSDPPMTNTPVHRVLERIGKHIIPLTLRDPDSPEFRPENCVTYHDIIRFCHEHAVREMFNFSSRNPFPRHAAKQLVCDVPMQWWVLNLDDGFAGEIEGPKVHIDDIVSVPMRAIWEGINMVPWEGPPPIDGKGFMSVMFEATKNTSLVTGVPSNYAERNYFMIAGNYCSINSRFGFHFASVETYVGERVPENYIHFRFKGGAADESRKKRRVRLIEELLTDWGFSIEVNEDVLRARFEDEPMEVMQQRLRIIGFLIMHTRQLDMVMSNEKMVSHYRNRIRGTINELFKLRN
jgi:pyruvate, water dikinase